MEISSPYTSDVPCNTEASSTCSAFSKQGQSSLDGRKSSPSNVTDSGYHSLSNVVCSESSYENNPKASTANVTVAMQTAEHDNIDCSNGIPDIGKPVLVSCLNNGLISRETTVKGSPMHTVENHKSCFGPLGKNVYPASMNNNANIVHQCKESQHGDSSAVKLHQSPAHTNGVYDSCSNVMGLSTNTLTTTPYKNGQDSLYQEHQYTFSKTSPQLYGVVKSHADNLLNNDIKGDWQDLAIKIEFCLMFGYTSVQIRAAISKLSWRASKNDILAELSALQSAPVPHDSSGISLVNSDYNNALGSHCYEGDGNLKTKGLNSLSGESLLARSPLPLENEHKEEEKLPDDDYKNLRPIVIDGSNVAMSHGNKQYFSCKGILLAVDYFRNRNHSDITVFVPAYRKESRRPDSPIRDREILTKLEDEHILVYTPSRCIDGKRVTCYDDRFILKLAQDTDGIIVSNDNFRDLKSERPEWKELIEKRVLMYSFVSDRFMPPDDPLGRNGPIIDNFLRKRPASEEQSKPQCPYGKKCTYGKKCKYFHPECPRSITDSLKEQSNKRMKASNLAEQLASELMIHDTPTTSTARPKSTTQAAKLSNQSFPLPVNGCEVEQCDEKPSSSNGIKPDNSRQHSQPRANNVPIAEQNCCHHCQCDGSTTNELVQSVHFPGPMNQNPMYAQCTHDAMVPTPYPQYQPSPNHLSDSLAQKLTISGSMQNQHPPPVPPRQPDPNAHHMCYDPQNQAYPMMTDPSRVHNSFSGPRVTPQQVVYPEAGPPDFHTDNTSVKHPMLKHSGIPNYRRSSPANLQMFDGRGGESVVQPQHLNVAAAYQQVPALHGPYSMSPRRPYYASYGDAQYPLNHPQPVPQQLMYPYPMTNNTHSAPRMHQNMMQTPYYASSLSPSTGSDSSLSLSYHFLPDRQSSTPMNQSLSSSNHSTSKTYPPPNMSRRIQSSPGHQVSLNMQQQRLHSLSHSNGDFRADGRRPHSQQSNSPMQPGSNGSPPLSSLKNPRHYLFKNLCSLFDCDIVTEVMSSHPSVYETKEIVKLCLRESELRQ